MGWAYLAAALPLCAFGLRAFARAARERERSAALRWFLIGVVLSAFGIDSVRILEGLTGAHPSPLAFLPLALVGGALIYVLIREWRRLGRERASVRAAALAELRGAELEALAAEAAVGLAVESEDPSTPLAPKVLGGRVTRSTEGRLDHSHDPGQDLALDR